MMISFVFISTCALSLNKNMGIFDIFMELNDTKQITKSLPENPILGTSSSFPIISAQGAIAVDLDSGVPLYEKNPDLGLLPASTTKIVTALIALDTFSLDQILTVPKGINVDGQKMGLFAGEQMKVEDLLYGLLVYSANDAAMTLAMNYPVSSESGISSYSAFIDSMNNKARKLSMNNSNFENPVGLDGLNQTTTARDLVRVSEVAMRNPIFSKIVGTKSITITDVTGKYVYHLENVNQLLGEVPGVLGIKTGWTENARENLVTFIENDNHKIVLVILGSQDRFGETKELINWIFENYEWQDVNVSILTGNNPR